MFATAETLPLGRVSRTSCKLSRFYAVFKCFFKKNRVISRFSGKNTRAMEFFFRSAPSGNQARSKLKTRAKRSARTGSRQKRNCRGESKSGTCEFFSKWYHLHRSLRGARIVSTDAPAVFSAPVRGLPRTSTLQHTKGAETQARSRLDCGQ